MMICNIVINKLCYIYKYNFTLNIKRNIEIKQISNYKFIFPNIIILIQNSLC